MKSWFFLLFLPLLFASCLSKQDVLQNPRVVNRGVPVERQVPPKHEDRPRYPEPTAKPSVSGRTSAGSTSLSSYDYIARYKDIAIEEMDKYGIPASIKLAQALLESGNGNSELARSANNHFGIKCTSDWSGGKTYQDDDRRDDCFRVYKRAEDSFRDHSQFLLRSRYAALFKLDKDDYKGWARGLRAAGYATNPKYADMLISLIERYELYQYDQPESRVAKVQREEKIQTELVAAHTPDESPAVEAAPPVTIEVHEVKSGDTLASIARKYGMSTSELMDLNGLKTESLFIGQLILVSM